MNNAKPICPRCGAELAPGRTVCWLCHTNLSALGQGDSMPPPVPRRHNEPAQSSLSSLLLFVILIVILGGMIATSPGIGILVTVLAIPALLRTAFITWRRRREGEFVSAGDQAGQFMLTLLIVFASCVAIAITVVVAFFVTVFVTCFAGGNDAAVRSLPAIVAAVAGIMATASIILILWYVRRKNRQGR
jgi:hypothetical protein